MNDLNLADDINRFCELSHAAMHGAGWWNVQGQDIRSYAPWVADLWIASKLALIHSEVSEGLEGHRKHLMDDKLPHRKMLEVELADAMLRISDLAGGLGLDLGGAIVEKMTFNAQRADHKPENRALPGGKSI